MKRIAILIGSLRQESYSKKIANYLIDNYSDQFVFEIVPIDFPHYNSDLDEQGGLSVEMQNFYETLEQVDGTIFITPEYNHSIPSVLKNAIDWASTKKVLFEKPALLIAASPGTTGAARAHSELRLILETLPMYTLPGNDILIGDIQTKFTEDGTLTCESTVNFLAMVLKKYRIFIEMIAH